MQGKRLIPAMAEDLNIPRGEKEEIDEWKARVLYSATGRIALSSLWDEEEPNLKGEGSYEGQALKEEGKNEGQASKGEEKKSRPGVSIIHFKKRAYRELFALAPLSQCLQGWAQPSIDKITEEIYRLYLANGYLYHASNRVAPARDAYAQAYTGANAQVNAKDKDLYLLRGPFLGERCSASGLGLYLDERPQKSAYEAKSPRELFALPSLSLREYLSRLTGDLQWNSFSLEGQVQYLRLAPPFTDGYWMQRPGPLQELSLLRAGREGGWLYFFYVQTQEGLRVSPLPSWRCDSQEYLRIAAGLLLEKGSLPATRYTYEGELVRLELGYLYPPSLQALLKLYSWPSPGKGFPGEFHRSMSPPVFASFVRLASPLGYTFLEE